MLPPWMSSERFTETWEKWAAAKIIRLDTWHHHEHGPDAFKKALPPSDLAWMRKTILDQMKYKAAELPPGPVPQEFLDHCLRYVGPISGEQYRYHVLADCPPDKFKEGANGAALPGGAAILVETCNKVLKLPSRRNPIEPASGIGYWVSVMDGAHEGLLVVLTSEEGRPGIQAGSQLIWAFGQEIQVTLLVPGIRIDKQWPDLPFLLASARRERLIFPIKPPMTIGGLAHSGLLD